MFIKYSKFKCKVQGTFAQNINYNYYLIYDSLINALIISWNLEYKKVSFEDVIKD